ncbi:hypothetical protein F1737_10010 [Methanoplanus sp. FWC-SCC4]|uniref:Uncharacterized protein n=1 Tax=Methanochimaera problematica TaxID=2609417 RepID=A0AA97I4Z9_9EURY|nr:hypothetical protein [Methanoplanus sp. FWC-SCC4]WOF16994.1 hypothetical protein F1737_10010 [Methanoplanus sp. FWC-SCC4]
MQGLVDQKIIMEKAEVLFEKCGQGNISGIEKHLISLGFIQMGGDPLMLSFENPEAGLSLNIEIDEEKNVHGYEILPYGEGVKKQEKIRW